MTAPEPTETLETHNIQGLILRGYGPLEEATFLLLGITNEERAREYLQGLCARINRGNESPEEWALQVAFTAPGLERLGVPKSARDTFSREFLEGMDDDIRAETLGDRGKNDPTEWKWGRRSPRPNEDPSDPKFRPVHMLLMVYAKKPKILSDQLIKERELLRLGFEILHEKETITLEGQKEHFGWRDGLSMPVIEGVPRERPKKKSQESWTGPIPAGEFVLGYRNDYKFFTEYPTVALADDPVNHLPVTHDGAQKSLGRNGSYLIYREMTQHVLEFWDYLATQSREPGSDPAARAIVLGAKMVGRWPGGAPLVTSPDRDRSERATDNAFMYEKDKVGLRCPPGAHIRRSNPRDVLAHEDRGHDTSIMMVRKHQMIRRGRAFGPPVSPKMNPREILAARGKPDDKHRGLHFICLVSNISRQFEFVQQAWVHSANFASLCKDGDPISAARREQGHENPNDNFTCPANPVRRKYENVPQFTSLVGGAYFFLPGIAALRFICRHPEPERA